MIEAQRTPRMAERKARKQAMKASKERWRAARRSHLRSWYRRTMRDGRLRVYGRRVVGVAVLIAALAVLAAQSFAALLWGVFPW
jgi:hypothetical protein